MEKLRWYFPEKLDEAVELLKEDGVVPHAGGTGLLRRGVQGIKGFVDLGRLPLNYFDAADGSVEIGATQTFEDASQNVKKADPGSVLPMVLCSLPPPIRNRITVGGSVALFPPWSIIMGPLIALDASVVLEGKNHGVYKIDEYVTNKSLKEKSLIKGIRFKTGNWKGVYYKASRTTFDYSSFNITFLMKRAGDRIEDLRVVVAGCSDRFLRLKELENELRGKNAGDVNVAESVKKVRLEFPAKKLGSPDYVKHVAMVELERGLEKMLTG